jgi:hypothetical protein
MALSGARLYPQAAVRLKPEKIPQWSICIGRHSAASYVAILPSSIAADVSLSFPADISLKGKVAESTAERPPQGRGGGYQVSSTLRCVLSSNPCDLSDQNIR